MVFSVGSWPKARNLQVSLDPILKISSSPFDVDC